MYEFRDTGIYTGYDEFIPSEAIIINGIPLERQIEGFMTLNVTGRELIAKKINSQDVDGIDGNVFVDSNYPTREITVKYQLKAPTNEDFRRRFELLNYYLRDDQFSFSFNDDREYFYVGTLSAIGEFPEGRNDGTATFTLTCSDPFKYKVKPSIYTSTNSSITINEPILYPDLPEEIAVTLSAAVSTFTLKSGSLTLTFNGTFKANDVVTIRPLSDDQILLNGVANVSLMTYTSPLEIFYLKENSVVTVSNGQLALKIRDKRL